MLRWQFKTRIRKLKLWETHTQSQIVHNASSFICHTIKSTDSTKLPQCLAFLRAFHKSVYFFQKLICFLSLSTLIVSFYSGLWPLHQYLSWKLKKNCEGKCVYLNMSHSHSWFAHQPQLCAYLPYLSLFSCSFFVSKVAF